MKITLDHNCIIHLENQTDVGARIQMIVSAESNECFIVNIGASEMREKGIRPDNYQRFEELLSSARIDHLPRINPICILDVTFWDRCIWSSEEHENLVNDIESILFGNTIDFELKDDGLDSPAGRKWLNRTCDVHSLWCHIHNKNDLFLTTDGNFTKKTKLSRLLSLGAGKICNPFEI